MRQEKEKNQTPGAALANCGLQEKTHMRSLWVQG
jgi:hypothetical protein